MKNGLAFYNSCLRFDRLPGVAGIDDPCTDGHLDEGEDEDVECGRKCGDDLNSISTIFSETCFSSY
jgi:hypothetical protein